MNGDAAAYETLGLKPGADRSAIEQAYKNLIKRYHPDRQGGDAARASEINRAYFQLRKAAGQPLERTEPGSVAEALYARRAAQLKRRRRKRGRVWPFLLLPALLVVYLKREPISIALEDGMAEIRSRIEPPVNEGTDAVPMAVRPASLDEPLRLEAIATSVERAALLHRRGDGDGLVEASRGCHQKLRAEATLDRLDQCAAFDDAVLELEGPNPMHDGGPFGATAVTARQMAGAIMLSDDYLAVEARLDRVRNRVQALIARQGPPPPLQNSGRL